MTHPAYIREKAVSLRAERNLTIDEIAQRLALSRTTVYHWVRDIPIERSGKPQSAAQQRRNAANAERYRLRRAEAYDLGRTEFGQLARDETFRDFICMYIGEGYKRSRNRVALANSDPVVISLATRWITRFAANKVNFALQYHADQDPAYLSRFWAFRLGVAPERIRRQRKSNSNQLSGRSWRSRYGVLSVGSDDTAFRARLQGWIDELKTDWSRPPG